MTSSLQDWAARADPFHEVGLMPGQSYPSALPRSDTSGNDKGATPWHPDSPIFWVVAILGLTLFGVVGLSVGGRAGPVKAGASLGKV